MEPQAMAGVAPDDVWLVGTARAYEADDWVGRIKHWDGKRWSVVPGPKSEYFTVTAVGPRNVLAAGHSAPNYRPNLQVAHCNGRSWRLCATLRRTGGRRPPVHRRQVSPRTSGSLAT